MTYQSAEDSVASGQPVELYDIAMGITHWRLTSSGEDKTYATHTYTSAPCKRNEIEKTEEVQKDSVEVTLPRGHAIGLLCVRSVPDEEITLTLYRGHPPFYITYFKGFLTYIEFDEENIATCTFEPRSSDLPFVGGRRRAMRLCGHLLYGYRCGVNREAYGLSGTIDSISGLTITATEFGDEGVDAPDYWGDITGLPECVYNQSSMMRDDTPGSEAFDDITRNQDYSNHWTSGGSTPHSDEWVSCRWTTGRTIQRVKILPGATPGWPQYCPKYLKIEGSNNGSTWYKVSINGWAGRCSAYNTDEAALEAIENFYDWVVLELDSETAYTYWRVFVHENWGGAGYSIHISEIEMIEADNTLEGYRFSAGGKIIIGTARRSIANHYGNTIIINRPFGPSVVAGSSFLAYPGCGHTPNECVAKYDNMLNYGGQTHLPVKNPYDDKLYY